MNKTSTGLAPFSASDNRFNSSCIIQGKSKIPGYSEYNLRSFTYFSKVKKIKSTLPKGIFGYNQKLYEDNKNTKWIHCVLRASFYNPEEMKNHSFNIFYKAKYFNTKKKN